MQKGSSEQDYQYLWEKETLGKTKLETEIKLQHEINMPANERYCASLQLLFYDVKAQVTGTQLD